MHIFSRCILIIYKMKFIICTDENGYEKGQTAKGLPPLRDMTMLLSLTLSIATDLAVIDFGKVIEQATKFHLLKIQTRQKFSPLTKNTESVPFE